MWKQNPDGTTNTQSFNKWMFEDAKRTLEEYNKKLKNTPPLTINEVKEANNKNLNTVNNHPSNSKNNL